jgi:hypothetical protein
MTRGDLEAGMDDFSESRFSCHDWMDESGFTREQQVTMLRLSTELNGAALNYIKEHPVSEWSTDDWKRYEISQWDCTAQMRTALLAENFTREQADAVAEAWEHERYVYRSIPDSCGRIHHCRFCRDTATG